MRCEVLNAPAVARAEIAVIIPARNEEERIGACLDTLTEQNSRVDVAVVVCVNNTEDRTVQIVRQHARNSGLAVVLAVGWLDRGGVGRARRLGHLLAMRHCPKACAFLSTDADCHAAPTWISAMDHALQKHPAALGRIEGMDDLPPHLLPCLSRRNGVEEDYMRLSREFVRLVSDRAPGAMDLNTAGGANMGVRRAAYRAAGGFRPMVSHEDRDLVDRLLALNLCPGLAEDAVVKASMRSEGRAPNGMADRLATLLSGGPAQLDSALVPVRTLLARCAGEPVVQRAPLSVAEAARDLPILEGHVAALRRIPSSHARHRYLLHLRQREDPGHPAAW